MIELAVLGLLKEQPLHGYEIKKRLGETLGALWGVSYGSLYPALRRLERAEAIAVLDPLPDARGPSASTGSVSGDLAAARRRPKASRLGANRRTRKAYEITERGNALLIELLLADDERTDDERSFGLRLAFCRHLPPAGRLELLQRRRRVLRDRLERVERPRAITNGSDDDRYSRSLREHRARATQRDLEWIESLIALEQAEVSVNEPPVKDKRPTKLSTTTN
ncbi:unannotated protein [freshwater metagenome]|uniref:Unannotated protein n=1 Tax=freshwater metagenome TaxID=449393 RepID=A0A6J7MQP9_9ZZZZ|nr:PadR family transcriptional regulator [Actinomycetota bacterium]MSV94851.1 PadR family transcriptional regulator [Actinomycetota bacterium]MSW61700.1 PadR family transcriptional regulator [Actinomycetota bacterium]MSY44113.1 PadR family transcriptional regulator [Actinomycetota bacterium]